MWPFRKKRIKHRRLEVRKDISSDSSTLWERFRTSGGPVSVLLGLGFWIAACLLDICPLDPLAYRQGQYVPGDIRSRVKFEVRSRTRLEEQVRLAREAVPAMFTADEKRIDAIVSSVALLPGKLDATTQPAALDEKLREQFALDEPALRELVSSEAPALVLLEPGFGGRGLELMRELRSDAGVDTTLLALVGPEELDRLEALCAAGAHDVVELPVRGGLLEHRVRTAIRQAEALCGVKPPEPAEPFAPGTRSGMFERFLGELAAACSRAGAIEQKLAVFSVRADSGAGPGATRPSWPRHVSQRPT